MPKVKTVIPSKPSREKGQRSLDRGWISRYIPVWAYPHWKDAEFWRSVVRTIPVAIDCRETFISYISSLDWKIEPRDSKMRDELKSEINYYTRLFERGGDTGQNSWDMIKLIEWILQEYLDTPFGGACETIRAGDKPNGKVMAIIPIDSATLFPTLDKKWPVAQVVEDMTRPVVFPWYAINRMFMSPRTDIRREGWGMPPPEKIFLALEMIRKGDVYYYKFLSDTPEAGILDLMDMDEQSALDWVKSFKDLFLGIDPLKIPVLYEHEIPAKWISFGKNPNQLEFNETYSKYVTLVCSAYGLTPTDIGFPSVGGGGGTTLGGAIRDERKTRRSSVTRAKKSLKYFFDRMLHPELEFRWIDLDDEVAVSLARARLANATAMGQYVKTKLFTQKEARLQTIADGLWSTSVPEDIPEEEFLDVEDAKAEERPGMLGSPLNAAEGGRGEIVARSITDVVHKMLENIHDVQLQKLAVNVLPLVFDDIRFGIENKTIEEIEQWNVWYNNVLLGHMDDIPELTLSSISLAETTVKDIIANEQWFVPFSSDLVKSVMKVFISRYVNAVTEKMWNDYISGKTSKFVSEKEVEVNKDVLTKFENEITEITNSFLSSVDLSKVIIAGLRDIILNAYFSGVDKMDKIDDNLSVYTELRSNLSAQFIPGVAEFIEQINQKIDMTLEEYVNG